MAEPAQNLLTQVDGWGADLDLKYRAGVPRDKKPMLGPEHLYPKSIRRQKSQPSVFKSIEHGKFPPVFGTACPPKDFSGLLRRLAFRYSEGRMSHWLILMLADRVDVIEGLFSDLLKGEVPNLFNEMGLKSELKYNKVAFQRKIVLGSLATVAIGLLILNRRRR